MPNQEQRTPGRQMQVLRTMAGAAVLAAATWSSPVMADTWDVYWSSPGCPGCGGDSSASLDSRDWEDSRNWSHSFLSLPGQPDWDDNAFINAGRPSIWWGTQAEAGNLQLTGGTALELNNIRRPDNPSGRSGQASLSVAQTFTVGLNSAATYSMAGGSTTAKLIILGDNGRGEYHLGNFSASRTATDLHVGYTRQGLVTQEAGSRNEVLGALYVGFAANAEGRYELSGGALSARTAVLGFAGTGTLVQQGGSIATGADLVLGQQLSGTGSYTLRGGDVDVGSDLIIGGDGEGKFEQTGGAVTVAGQLTVGQAETSSASGHYVLRDGTLTTQGGWIGRGGFGLFEQHGGVHRVNGQLGIGYYGGSNGSYGDYTIWGGELIADSMIVNRAVSNGYFYQLGGQVTIANTMTLSEHGGHTLVYLDGADAKLAVGDITTGTGTSELRLNNGSFMLTGSTIAVNTLVMANSTDSDMHVKLGAGQSMSAVLQTIGKAGRGALVQTGGTNLASALSVGGETGSQGSYTLDGGELEIGFMSVGASGEGTFNLNGGTHSVGQLTLGYGAGGQGQYHMRGGQLGVNTLRYGPGSGTFTQTGGINQVTTVLTVKGNNHRYELAGGELHAARIVAADGAFGFTGGQLSADVFEGNLVNDGGTLAPGRSAGQTHVTADYAQSSAATLLIELAGATDGLFDVLIVDGAANLAGTLEVVLLDGYIPSPGDSFMILSATTLQGQFEFLQLAPLSAALGWNLNYERDPFSMDSLSLNVIAVPEPQTWALLLAGAMLVIARTRRTWADGAHSSSRSG